MMERILARWSIQRAFYLIAGMGVIVISLVDRQWVVFVLGTYFALMGLFSFGCAGSQCNRENGKCDR